MNLRASIEQNVGQSPSPAANTARERFMVVVPEALHSFPVS